MSHIPYAAEHPDDDPTWHADGSSLDRVFVERDRYLSALQQIAAAGPMFTPDDWRWKVARDAVKGQGAARTPADCPIGIAPENSQICSAGTCYTCIARRLSQYFRDGKTAPEHDPILLRAAGYAQGVAHARACVADHRDWNPGTIREDLLLNIDTQCTGYVPPEALADYPEIPDTPEERAYHKGWNDAVVWEHGPFEVVSDDDVTEIFGAPV